jgi:hypothetical protein
MDAKFFYGGLAATRGRFVEALVIHEEFNELFCAGIARCDGLTRTRSRRGHEAESFLETARNPPPHVGGYARTEFFTPVLFADRSHQIPRRSEKVSFLSAAQRPRSPGNTEF